MRRSAVMIPVTARVSSSSQFAHTARRRDEGAQRWAPFLPSKESPGLAHLLSASRKDTVLGGKEKRANRKEGGQRRTFYPPHHVGLQTDTDQGLVYATSFATFCCLHGLSRRVQNISSITASSLCLCWTLRPECRAAARISNGSEASITPGKLRLVDGSVRPGCVLQMGGFHSTR